MSDKKPVYVKKISAANLAKAEQLFKAASFYDTAAGKAIDFTGKLVTRQNILELKPIIDLLWRDFKYVPTKLNDVVQDFLDLGIRIKYIDETNGHYAKLIEAMTQACVMRTSRSYYNIFITPLGTPTSHDSENLHELGHIKYNHTINLDNYIKQFKSELEKVWNDKLMKYFEDIIHKNPKNKDKIVKILYHQFSNIAQDMEINSKLFGAAEWKNAKEIMARTGMLMHMNWMLAQYDDLSGLLLNDKQRKSDSALATKISKIFSFLVSNIEKRLNKDYAGEDFQYCYPTNKGWPEELDWMTYMVLLLKDLDNTMEHVLQQIQQAMGQNPAGPGTPNQKSQGQNQPGGNQPQQQQQSGSGKQMSQQTLDDYFDQIENQEDAAEDQNGSGASEEDDEEETEEEFGTSGANGRNEGGDGRGKGGGACKVDFESVDTYEDFSKLLHKYLLGKKNIRIKTDVLYYTNRKKMNGQVIYPRRKLDEKWVPTAATFVIDISGSVPTDYVEKIVNTLVDSASGIDLNRSHIIFCDTDVRSDEIMSKRTKAIYAGGGTTIARGIKYAAKYMKKSTDKLFVISDFGDDLNSWASEAVKIPGMKYAIGYGFNPDSNSMYNPLASHSGSSFAAKWNKAFTKTILIKEAV
jgi:hypothetical protein